MGDWKGFQEWRNICILVVLITFLREKKKENVTIVVIHWHFLVSNALFSSLRDIKTRFRFILISPKQLWVTLMIKSSFPFQDFEKSLPNSQLIVLVFTEAHWLRRTAQKRAQEELPLAQSQGWRPRAPGCDDAGAAKRNYPKSEVGAAAQRRYPTSKVRSSGCALLEQT